MFHDIESLRRTFRESICTFARNDLHGVSNCCGGPAEDESSCPCIGDGDLEPLAEVAVLLLVDLQPALDQVERGDLDKKNGVE